jgi:hypothetical protein
MGVVEGAKLSDAAGQALSEIDSVTKNLAQLIQTISQATQTQPRYDEGRAEHAGHPRDHAPDDARHAGRPPARSATSQRWRRSSRARCRVSSCKAGRGQGQGQDKKTRWLRSHDRDFDLGPLSWVKTEIDHSLNQARENLDKLAANAGRARPVKYILTHLHQATGALAMVGLARRRASTRSSRSSSASSRRGGSALCPSTCDGEEGDRALSRTSTRSSRRGRSPDALLAPYLELNRARGQSDANEGDLFFPNLGAACRRSARRAALDDAVLAKALAHQRSQYQQGCCACSRAATLREALRQMHARSSRSNRCRADRQPPVLDRRGRFFDALVFGGIEVGPA